MRQRNCFGAFSESYQWQKSRCTRAGLCGFGGCTDWSYSTGTAGSLTAATSILLPNEPRSRINALIYMYIHGKVILWRTYSNQVVWTSSTSVRYSNCISHLHLSILWWKKVGAFEWISASKKWIKSVEKVIYQHALLFVRKMTPINITVEICFV